MSKTAKPEIIYYPNVAEGGGDSQFDLKNGSYAWTQQLRILADKEGYEVHTPDRAKFRNVAGVLFFDNMFFHNVASLRTLFERGLLDKTIYIDYEPPSGHAKKHEPESIRILSKMFKHVVTYDDDLAGTGNFVKCNVANFYSERLKKAVDFEKKKLVCMATNNTTNDTIIKILNNHNYTTYYNRKNIKYHAKAIYHKRQKIAEKLLEAFPNDFDLYGCHWPEQFRAVARGYLNREDKISRLGEYKFAITFDSYTHQRGYISEKIFDAFFAKTIPVYLGADNVEEYIPKECFVDVRDFDSYAQLFDYLASMDKHEYTKRLRAIENFLSSREYNQFFSSAAIARTLMSLVKNSAKANYDREEAEGILRELERERDNIRPAKPCVTRIDKAHKEKGWCFEAIVSPGLYEGREDGYISISKTYGGASEQVRTYKEATLGAGQNELKFDIPYSELLLHKKECYYVTLGDKLHKLLFRATEVIDGTEIDKRRRFKVSGNKIFIKRRLKV